MQRNLDLTRGLIHSQQVLLLLTEKGCRARTPTASCSARPCRAGRPRSRCARLLEQDPQVAQHVKARDLDHVFDLRTHFRDVNRTFKAVGL
jgi:adenylosuccinate lyase